MDYFAYGTTLSKLEMKKTCPGAKPKCIVVLPNYKLVFTGWSRVVKGATATILPMRGERVPGAVWEIAESELQRLDRYEEYPVVYNRINVLVLKDDGDALHAFTYIKKQLGEPGKPSPEYLALIRQGYKDWGINRQD
jgi:gamma-glutamylcyclotransferase